MLNYTLGTIEASEALIKDLYIDLRANTKIKKIYLYPFHSNQSEIFSAGFSLWKTPG